MPRTARAELLTFLALGATQGWKACAHNDAETVRFDVETSPTDEVTFTFSDHGPQYGDLELSVSMYPEAELTDATPQRMAATVARWLRDAAATLEAASQTGGGAP